MPIFSRSDKDIRNIFMLDGVPSFEQFYSVGIHLWKSIYKGYYEPFHCIAEPTINNPEKKRKRAYLSMGKAVCSELANLIWAEGCRISVNQKDFDLTSGKADPLDTFIQTIFNDNNFISKMREVVEQECALGGYVIRAYVDGLKNENGEIVKGTEKVKLGYFMADKFVPISWDNIGIKEAVFIEHKAKGGKYYTKLEFHKRNGEEYVVSNKSYKTDTAPVGDVANDILGQPNPLAEIWTGIAEETTMKNIKGALFSYFAPSIANNLDDNSPLGVSVYANAVETLKNLDVAFDSLCQEIKLGKKRIIVPASAVRTIRDNKGNEHRYFDADDSVYEAFSTDSTDDLKIKDNSVELRIDEHVKAINTLLDILCVQLGLSVGTLSFNEKTGLKTATEVVSENSKTYRTVKLMQEPIRKSIADTVNNIIQLCELYDVKVNIEGKDTSIHDLVKKGYDVSVIFDDSIVQDRDAEVSQGILLCNSGLMSKHKFMTDILGYTPEQADAEISRLVDEGKMSVSQIDFSQFEV